MNNSVLEKLPSVPDYFRTYVDRNVDLNTTKSIPCPFHGETHGKSFSYAPMLGKWRCWGACHTGGDVVELHRLNYKLKSREEALQSLCSILGIDLTELTLTFDREKPTVDVKDVYRRRVYALACDAAKTPEQWLELDYILSKAPFDVTELEVFCAKCGRPISQKENLEENKL